MNFNPMGGSQEGESRAFPPSFRASALPSAGYKPGSNYRLRRELRYNPAYVDVQDQDDPDHSQNI